MSASKLNGSVKRQGLVAKAQHLSTADVAESVDEVVLLKLVRHPKKRSAFNFLMSEEYWSVVVTTRRALFLSEGKSYAQLILGLLTGGLGAYFLKPAADRVKPGAGRKAIDMIGTNVDDSVLQSVKNAYDHRKEIVFDSPCAIRSHSEDDASFTFDTGTLTFGEKEYMLADHSSYQGTAFLKAEWHDATVILPGLDAYKENLTRCIAFLLAKGKREE